MGSGQEPGASALLTAPLQDSLRAPTLLHTPPTASVDKTIQQRMLVSPPEATEAGSYFQHVPKAGHPRGGNPEVLTQKSNLDASLAFISGGQGDVWELAMPGLALARVPQLHTQTKVTRLKTLISPPPKTFQE